MNMRPFSHLGDQQLLAQTRRLAGNRRCLEVHILDHLGEIDRRGLALRRGFSSLFDYAVRELRFSDAAAQRRIQALRLCRRHGWVRDKLQNGALTLTAAAQLETAIAGAERHGKQEVARRGGAQPAGNGRPPGGRGLVGGGTERASGNSRCCAGAPGAATAGPARRRPARHGMAGAATGAAAAGSRGGGSAAAGERGGGRAGQPLRARQQHARNRVRGQPRPRLRPLPWRVTHRRVRSAGVTWPRSTSRARCRQRRPAPCRLGPTIPVPCRSSRHRRRCATRNVSGR